MPEINSISPALVLEYTDQEEGFKGWWVRDRVVHRLCAGGLRIQAGLNKKHLIMMAANMTRKMQIAGIRVDGAKCGIDYDPEAPGRTAALLRFVRALKPLILSCYSVGPDLNVEMAELDKIAATLQIPSVKIAIAETQELSREDFFARYSSLGEMVDGHPLGWLRAGCGPAAAALALLEFKNIPFVEATIAIQGFGSLAKGALHLLAKAGVRVVAISDAKRCFMAPASGRIEVGPLLGAPGSLLPEPAAGSGIQISASAAIMRVQCDVLIPAAIEEAITDAERPLLGARSIVPGANLAVSPEAELGLEGQGVLVLPDFLAGCGGSLAMDILFGSPSLLPPAEVVELTMQRMKKMVHEVLRRSAAEHISPTRAALLGCIDSHPSFDAKPYG